MASKNEKTGSERAPRVDAPLPEATLGKVGIVALVGFVIGIVWPRLAGVSLVPEAPVDELLPSPSAEASAASLVPDAPSAPTKQITARDLVAIGEPSITSCRDADGKKVKDCGRLDTDALVHGALLALTECPGALGAFGRLSLGFEIDFGARKIGGVESGRSTNVPASVTKELLSCAKTSLAGVDPSSVPHTHASYTVYYVLDFKRPEEVVGDASAVTKASGTATVRWQTALVREEPTRDGKVVTRLLSGARVVVTGKQGDWYRVKYDDRGREAWLHGASIGM